MLDWKLLDSLLLGRKPPLPNVFRDAQEELLPEGLTMGTLYIGRQGTGKTSSLARHIVEYLISYHDRGIFVLDWSGSISKSVLTQILHRPKDLRERLLKRVVYDEFGNPDWVVPLPEFSEAYGSSYEEQVQRVSVNLSKLQPFLVQGAPVLGGLTLKEMAPQIFRMLTAIVNERGETWQVTEAKKLLIDLNQLSIAIKNFGYKVPEAKWYLKNEYLELRKNERMLRRYALIALLGAIEPKETRAKVGFYRPGWTPQEVLQKGLMVLVDGSRLINKRNTQDYLFTQVYSLIMAEINKRQPGNPKYKPVALVMDEVYSLLSIPGMAEEIGMLAPLYRSRKLELYIVLQALSQLAPTLEKQIWSIGNIVCFGVSNFDEAYDIAQQLFSYDPQRVKMQAKTENQQPLIEPDRGQYLAIANIIQRLKHRECVIRRYISEEVQDKFVRYVARTKENPDTPLDETVDDVKERLIRERAVPIKEALEIINQRKLTIASGTKKKPPQI